MKKVSILLCYTAALFCSVEAKNKGLEWGDNSCYFDSSIQLLAHIDGFNKDLKDYKLEKNMPASTYIKLIDLIKDVWTREFPYLKSGQILEQGVYLRSFHLSFSSKIDKGSGATGQKDANEFIRYLMNEIMESIDSLKPSLFNKFKEHAIFEFGLTEKEAGDAASAQISKIEIINPFSRLLLNSMSLLRCTACNNASRHVSSPDFIMELPIENSNTLLECLSEFFGEEKLDEYKCDNCKRVGNAYKSFRISSLPDYLIICLKRNKYNPVTSESFKLTKSIKFNSEIDLISSLHLLTDDLKNKLKTTQVKYKLRAFVVHGGQALNSGHYWAYGRDAYSNWFLYNDAQVLLANDSVKNVVDTGLDNNVPGYSGATPYIILYEKEERLLQSKPQQEASEDLLVKRLNDLQKSISSTKNSVVNVYKKLESLKNKLQQST